MRRLILSIILVAAAVSIAGCASPPADAGFSDVQKDLSQRNSKLRVQWNRMSADDAAVARAVRSMLAKPLGVDAAVQIALLNNRNLQATYEDLGVAQADLVQAGLLRNPVFDGAVEFTNGSGTKLQFSIVENFLDLLQIPIRKRVAQSAFATTKLRVISAVLDLNGRVRASFVNQQAADQMLELRQSVAEATGASFELAKRLHDAGNTTDLSLRIEQLQHEQAKLDLAAAETAAVLQRERLNVLLGLWGADTRWTLVEHLPEIPADEMDTDNAEQEAVQRSLHLALAEQEVEALARTLGIKRSFGLLSETEIGVASEKEARGPWEIGPAISFPIPLLDQGQAAVAAAVAQLERGRQKYYARAVEVRSSARMARINLLAARKRAIYIKQIILPLRRQVLDHMQLQYNGMLVGAFQLLTAKQDEIEAGVQFVQALRDYWLARTQFEQVISGQITEFAANEMTSDASLISGASQFKKGDHP